MKFIVLPSVYLYSCKSFLSIPNFFVFFIHPYFLLPILIFCCNNHFKVFSYTVVNIHRSPLEFCNLVDPLFESTNRFYSTFDPVSSSLLFVFCLLNYLFPLNPPIRLSFYFVQKCTLPYSIQEFTGIKARKNFLGRTRTKSTTRKR
jgi:hypothetical protein